MVLSNAVYAFSGQLLSSASNFIFPLIAFAFLSTEQFGTFSISYIFLQFVFGLHRVFVCENKLIVNPAGTSSGDSSLNLYPTIAFALVFGVFYYIVIAAVGVSDLERTFLIALSPVLLCTNDYYRYTYIQCGAYIWVFYSELIWLLVGAALAVMHVVFIGEIGSINLLLYWILGSFSGLAFYIFVKKHVHNLNYIFGFELRQILLEIKWSFFLGYLITRGGNILVLYLLSSMLGLEEIGRLQGAIQIFTPVLVLLTFWEILGLKYLSRILDLELAKILKVSDFVLSVMIVVLVIWYFVVSFMHSAYSGDLFLSSNWGFNNLVLLVIYSCSMSASMIYIVSCKSLDMGQQLLFSQCVFTIVRLCGSLVVCASFSISGVFIVWSLTSLLFACHLRQRIRTVNLNNLSDFE